MDTQVIREPTHPSALIAVVALKKNQTQLYATFPVKNFPEIKDINFRSHREITVETPRHRLAHFRPTKKTLNKVSLIFGLEIFEMRKIEEISLNCHRDNPPHVDIDKEMETLVMLYTSGPGTIFYVPKRPEKLFPERLNSFNNLESYEQKLLLCENFDKKQVGQGLGLIFRTAPLGPVPLIHHSPNEPITKTRVLYQCFIDPNNITLEPRKRWYNIF